MELGKDILVADAGGTSTRWCLLGRDGCVKRDLHTAPINVCVHNDLELKAALAPIDVLLESSNEVFFYGAGCAGQLECSRMIHSFREIGYSGAVHVNSDMLGTARALFASESGIACILGTGSNSCRYDGTEIVQHTPPLGYILGDEGSGASIGKRFLKYLIRGKLSSSLVDKFVEQTQLTVSDIYEKVYREPRANKFLGSLVPFLSENLTHKQIHSIIEEEFDDFFGNIVCKYKGVKNLPVRFTGSVAYYFEQILRTTASRHGLTVDRVVSNPMEGLLKYHNPNYN